MAEPGFLWRLEEVKAGIVGSKASEPVMKGGLSCIALAFGLLTETSLASGQAANSTLVAQGPSSTPPSGILATPPPAPVFVPPSGVLPNVERGPVRQTCAPPPQLSTSCPPSD